MCIEEEHTMAVLNSWVGHVIFGCTSDSFIDIEFKVEEGKPRCGPLLQQCSKRWGRFKGVRPRRAPVIAAPPLPGATEAPRQQRYPGIIRPSPTLEGFGLGGGRSPGEGRGRRIPWFIKATCLPCEGSHARSRPPRPPIPSPTLEGFGLEGGRARGLGRGHCCSSPFILICDWPYTHHIGIHVCKCICKSIGKIV